MWYYLAFFLSSFAYAQPILSPGFMGPNALPVPKVGQSRIGTDALLSLGFEQHFDPGEEYTFNPRLEVFLPHGPYTALRLTAEPWERFYTSPATQKRRQAHQSQGWSPGDLYFGSSFQILQQNQYYDLDLILNLTTKTTTGKNLKSARHTNSPGYLIDLTLGRQAQHPTYKLSITSYLGFLAWQSNFNEQNDAFAYGMRLYWESKSHGIALEHASYFGWQKKLDMPAVYRCAYHKFFLPWRLSLAYQHGVRDAFPHTITLSSRYQVRLDSTTNTWQIRP